MVLADDVVVLCRGKMDQPQAEAFEQHVVLGTPYPLYPLQKAVKPFPRHVREMGTTAWIHPLQLVCFDPQKCLKKQKKKHW